MKRILITGANSYIGTSFENYIRHYTKEYEVDTVDMVDEAWKIKSFSGYDVLFHVAGIAHSDTGAISPEKEKLYRTVNTELTISTAEKAKREGVKQFIFMSSAIVYGDSAPFGKHKVITKETPASPSNCYGDSKLQAENGLRELGDTCFKVVILRPPMIYGKGSRGNYPTLSMLAQKLPLFPNINNCRSMLYIEHLLEFVKLMIDNEEAGLFWPQNKEYSNTSQMVYTIANIHGKKIKLTRAFNWLLPIARRITGLVDKAFGSLVYEQEMSEYKDEYRKFSLEESICKTER